MKVSYNWLQEYIEKELPNPKDLADLLNIRAFEVEEVEEKDGDSVFEIKITPNRAPDCLGHWGIAKEISIHTGIPFSLKEIPEIEPQFETEFKVENEEGSCVRYMMREVRNVSVTESPLELKLKLESIGQRSINTIVDITNVVMYETGQPMHAFDLEKLSGKTIKIGSPKDPHITTLDNKEVELTPEDLTIQDEKDNLAIAGVKGGKKPEVDSNTKNIILESANFFPVKVRKTSKRTNVQTDSSKRFENGITPHMAQKALNLAAYYIQKYASIPETKYSNIVDIYPRPQKRKYSVGLDFKNVAKRLGTEVSAERVEEILVNLGIEIEKVTPRERVLKLVQETVGKPYFYGSSVLFDAPDKFDCSSLSSYAYSMSGISIPRISIDQYVFFKPVEKNNLKPGDLIFANTGITTHGIYFETKEFLPGTKVEKGVDHVGIYMGDNKVLHANSRTGNVAIEDIDSVEYFKDVVGYGTLPELDDERYVLHIPYERLDLTREIDIIEEIGRVYGYENIPSASALIEKSEDISLGYNKLVTIKSHLIDLGFDEVITYSFQKKGDIGVYKPLAADKSYLRTNLSKGIIDALELNFKNKDLFAEDTIKIFEIGNVFVQDKEILMIALGVKSANKKNKTKVILEETIKVLSEKLGVEIKVDIKDQQEVLEIELAPVLESIKQTYNSLYPFTTKPYESFSLYPFMSRDIAVWAKNTKTKDEVEAVIKSLATDLLVRCDLFDEYKQEEKTSYAYRLVFQSYERTLTDDEVNPIMEKIYSTLQSDPDFEIR